MIPLSSFDVIDSQKFTSGSKMQIFLALFDLYLFILFGDILFMLSQDKIFHTY